MVGPSLKWSMLLHSATATVTEILGDIGDNVPAVSASDSDNDTRQHCVKLFHHGYRLVQPLQQRQRQ